MEGAVRVEDVAAVAVLHDGVALVIHDAVVGAYHIVYRVVDAADGVVEGVLHILLSVPLADPCRNVNTLLYIQSRASGCEKCFVTCFLKVPLACMGSTAAQ